MERLKKITRTDRSFAAGFSGPPYLNEGGPRQVDWKKATEFIKWNRGDIEVVEVGLAEDFSCTSQLFWDAQEGFELEEGISFYGCSNWATPAIYVEYRNGDKVTFECWEYGENHGYISEQQLHNLLGKEQPT